MLLCSWKFYGQWSVNGRETDYAIAKQKGTNKRDKQWYTKHYTEI
jgi:hypothetical protein